MAAREPATEQLNNFSKSVVSDKLIGNNTNHLQLK